MKITIYIFDDGQNQDRRLCRALFEMKNMQNLIDYSF